MLRTISRRNLNKTQMRWIAHSNAKFLGSNRTNADATLSSFLKFHRPYIGSISKSKGMIQFFSNQALSKSDNKTEMREKTMQHAYEIDDNIIYPKSIEQEEGKELDNPSILGGNPLPNPPDISSQSGKTITLSRRKGPKSLKEWKTIFRETQRMYVRTWDGFFDNMKEKKETKEEEMGELMINKEAMHEAKEQISDNVNKNVEAIKESGSELLGFAKKETGIYSKDDLKKMAKRQMKLATECLGEFMKGYRTGRDDEIDKMMNEYFQELEDDLQNVGNESANEQEQELKEEETPKRTGRRRRKRRMPTLVSD